jgi:arylsulfatase A-like enzyme
MNVIVVILDSLRRDHVGAYGNDQIRTPTLDAVAKEGLRFTRAHPDAMPTIPARRAIHTGMRTLSFKVRWAPIPEEQTTLAEILKKEGYHTALITDTYHQFFMNIGRGFEVYRKIRGQESDPYKDPSIISEEWMRERYIILG